MGKIYDGFMFFNELELLEIRLNELDQVIDKFILVESPVTHSGNPKPLYYRENAHLFERFNDRIIHVIYNPPPEAQNSWDRERGQRDAIRLGVPELEDEDFVIISDADEIPSAESITKYSEDMGVAAFNQNLFYFWLNTYSCGWAGPKAIPYHEYIKGESLSKLRGRIDNFVPCERYGWHFSYLGGKDRVLQKLESYAHVEMNSHENRKNINDWVNNAILWNGQQLKICPIDDTFPDYLVQNKEKFNHLIKTHGNQRIFV
jgi:beta-1,4-mannosyl-glycoprotein beta-1,4-N-acetylglucosaminyltransferase